MPIYAYKCSACGFAKDVLQKMSDAPLTVCPSCQAQCFTKQVTAAGFHLKGTGWYVTDFKDSGKPPAALGAKAAEAESKPAATTTDTTSTTDKSVKPPSSADAATSSPSASSASSGNSTGASASPDTASAKPAAATPKPNTSGGSKAA